MKYSVIGETEGVHWQHDLVGLRVVVPQLVSLLEELPLDASTVVPAEFVPQLDQMKRLLYRLHTAVPQVGPLFLCGYRFTSGKAWTTWSAHEDRRTARRWLEAWRVCPKLSHRQTSEWDVIVGQCAIDRFMPKGTKIATVMDRL